MLSQVEFYTMIDAADRASLETWCLAVLVWPVVAHQVLTTLRREEVVKHLVWLREHVTEPDPNNFAAVRSFLKRTSDEEAQRLSEVMA